MTPTINTRADLNALRGTPAYDQFIAHLRGTLTQRADTQTYPPDYDRALKAGDTGYLAPIWSDLPDPTIAARFGFTPEQLQA